MQRCQAHVGLFLLFLSTSSSAKTKPSQSKHFIIYKITTTYILLSSFTVLRLNDDLGTSTVILTLFAITSLAIKCMFRLLKLEEHKSTLILLQKHDFK